MYSIGQVAEMFGLPISTLRYYDKQGLFPNMERVSGIRKFSEAEIEALRVIECLKKAGMESEGYTFWALLLFVGIPLPRNRSLAGTLAASILDWDFKRSVLAVMLGVILAGIIMGTLSLLFGVDTLAH